MKLFKSLEKLKALRLVKTMVTLSLVSGAGLSWYIWNLPISITQKVITLVLAGVVLGLSLIAEDHMDKESYIDEFRKEAEKWDKANPEKK